MHKINCRNLNCRNLNSINKIGRLSLPHDPRSHILPYWSFLKSEETWYTILTFTYFKVRRDLVYHFWPFLFIYVGKAFHVTFFRLTEAKRTTCFSDREGIAYHNDQSGKTTPIILENKRRRPSLSLRNNNKI